MITTTSVRCQVAAIVSCSCLGLEGRADKRVLLLTASPPLPEETWQFGQAPKVGGRTCFGMRRGADQDCSGPEPGCPTSGVSAVIDDQRPLRLHASVGEEARIVLRAFFEGIDQVGPVEMAEAVPHTHPFTRPGQFQ